MGGSVDGIRNGILSLIYKEHALSARHFLTRPASPLDFHCSSVVEVFAGDRVHHVGAGDDAVTSKEPGTESLLAFGGGDLLDLPLAKGPGLDPSGLAGSEVEVVRLGLVALTLRRVKRVVQE